jgi:hypothetical protein
MRALVYGIFRGVRIFSMSDNLPICKQNGVFPKSIIGDFRRFCSAAKTPEKDALHLQDIMGAPWPWSKIEPMAGHVEELKAAELPKKGNEEKAKIGKRGMGLLSPLSHWRLWKSGKFLSVSLDRAWMWGAGTLITLSCHNFHGT